MFRSRSGAFLPEHRERPLTYTTPVLLTRTYKFDELKHEHDGHRPEYCPLNSKDPLWPSRIETRSSPANFKDEKQDSENQQNYIDDDVDHDLGFPFSLLDCRNLSTG